MKFLNFLLIFLICCLGYCQSAYASQNLKVKQDAIFEIKLKSNPTTGYDWQLAEPINNNYLLLITSQYIPQSTELVGAGGEEVWIFKALKSGKTKIYFKYVRSWEHKKPIHSTTFVVKIE